MKTKAAKIKAFVYVDGDKTKTPVKLADQKAGTKLVLVNDRGRDLHFIQGLVKKADKVKQKASIAKAQEKMKKKEPNEE